MEEDSRLPVHEEIVPNAKRLYLFFGGIAARLGMPPFEFYKSSQILGESRILFRDLSQLWYQCGFPSVASDVFKLSEFINRKIKKSNAKDVIFVGNSMGGFAAILFASLLGKGKAIAFSPQTFISLSKRLIHYDWRWQRQIFNTYRKSIFKKHIYDLRSVLENNSQRFSVDIYVSNNARLDCIHAYNIHDFENVTIHEYEVGGHNLVRHLRDMGQLAKILKAETDGQSVQGNDEKHVP